VRSLVTLAFLHVVLVLCAAPLSAETRTAPLATIVLDSRNADVIPRHGIIELALAHNGIYRDPYSDVTVEATFRAPSGTYREVRGFYYGRDVWKVRFRPREVGHWTYSYVITSADGGFRQQGTGAFDCEPSEAEGPVRRHPENPFRWIIEENATAGRRLYFPLGLQDCIPAPGPSRPMRVDGSESRRNESRPLSYADYFALYRDAGFNLFRFSQRNCSYSLFDDLDRYREAEILATDDLLATARAQGFRVMFGFFGFYNRWVEGAGGAQPLTRLLRPLLGLRRDPLVEASDVEQFDKQQRFVAYAVARWGVHADFWELLNEREASDAWTTLMAEHVRSVDPERKPVTTSWEKPDLPAIDINAPHWYESESERESDLRVEQQAASWKAAGKPVIVGEQGNKGMNWDPLSATRLRIRSWTGLFEEVSFILWNTSWSKRGMFGGHHRQGRVANIYLGPEERTYTRALQAFAARLDVDVRMVPVQVSAPNDVRAYGLVSATVAAAYLHHFADHSQPLQGLTVTLAPPTRAAGGQLFAQWTDPATGQEVGRSTIPSSTTRLEVPPFRVDLALLLTTNRPISSHSELQPRASSR